MAFWIRKKRKGSPSAPKGKDVLPHNDQTVKERLCGLAELDAIAEHSRKPQRGESNLDSFDEEP